MGNPMDVLLALLLAVVVGLLLWLDRARVMALVARPSPTADGGAAQLGYYWRLTRQSGFTPFDAWPFYMGAKVVLAMLLPALAMELGGVGLIALWLAPVGFMLPDVGLIFVRRQRQAAIRKALSFYLDLLVSLLQAGLSLEVAVARAAREGLPQGHPLADEALRVVEELKLGRDRSLGFQMLADRTGVSELRGLANALSVGLTQGGSIEATLKAQAELVRAKRREEGLRRLNVANAKVLLPLMLCGFPVFVVLVFVPLALKLVGALGELGRILRPQ